MPAPAIDAVLHELSGQIPGEILRETLNQSPYLDLPKVETHVEEMGKLQQILTYDRSLPANPITWTDITTSNGENGGACVPPAQSLQITQTLREWNLQHTALHSPYFCTNDLRDAMKAKDQMDQIFGILAENTAQVMIDRNRSEYTRLAGHKIICSLEDGLLDDDEWLAQEPTSILTGGMLKKVYTKLVRLGGQKCSYGTVDGRPSFLGIGGMEITERIFTEEDVCPEQRPDHRAFCLYARPPDSGSGASKDVSYSWGLCWGVARVPSGSDHFCPSGREGVSHRAGVRVCRVFLSGRAGPRRRGG